MTEADTARRLDPERWRFVADWRAFLFYAAFYLGAAWRFDVWYVRLVAGVVGLFSIYMAGVAHAMKVTGRMAWAESLYEYYRDPANREPQGPPVRRTRRVHRLSGYVDLCDEAGISRRLVRFTTDEEPLLSPVGTRVTVLVDADQVEANEDYEEGRDG